MKKIISIILIFVSFFCVIFYLQKKNNSVYIIKHRGTILVGTTGDYQPMSYFDKEKNVYVGFDIALAEDLAKSLNVKIKYVNTSWSNLMHDTVNNKFDVAISGITITEERKILALMSNGYLQNGKTILCRKEDAHKYISLDTINNPNVRLIENPGGLNEKFARKYLPKAKLIIHNVNEEIPELITRKKADVMITEVIEALYYANKNPKLAVPLANYPFTHGKIGILVPKKNKSLLKYINNFIDAEQKSGRLDELKKIYIYNQN